MLGPADAARSSREAVHLSAPADKPCQQGQFKMPRRSRI